MTRLPHYSFSAFLRSFGVGLVILFEYCLFFYTQLICHEPCGRRSRSSKKTVVANALGAIRVCFPTFHLYAVGVKLFREIWSAKKDQLKELYQLLKSRDSIGNLLHASTERDGLIIEEDAECNAFLEVYEHGSINDLMDWPTTAEPSPSPSPSPYEPERSPPHSERPSASPAPPVESLIQELPVAKSPSTISSPSVTPASPASSVSRHHFSQRIPSQPLPSSPSPPQLLASRPPSPPSPPFSPSPSRSRSPSPPVSASSAPPPLSPKPVAEPPVEETQEVDPSSDLASEAAPRQDISVPSSPETPPGTFVPLKDGPVEEETVEPEAAELQPVLSEDEEVPVNSIVVTSPSPKAMEEVIIDADVVQEDDTLQQDQRDQQEPLVIVESVPEIVEEVSVQDDQITELRPSPPPQLPLEMPRLEELEEEPERIAEEGNADADEEKAVSQSVIDIPDLHESPVREIETHVVSPEAVESAISLVEVTSESLPLDIVSTEQDNNVEMQIEEQSEIRTPDKVEDSTEIAEGNLPKLNEVETRDDVVPVSPTESDQGKHDLIVEEIVPDKEPSPALRLSHERQEQATIQPDAIEVAPNTDDIEEGISSPIEDARIPLLRPMVLIDSPEEFDSPTRSPSGSLTRSPSVVHELPSPAVGNHIDSNDTRTPENMQEDVNEGRMTRSRSRALEESLALGEQRAASQSLGREEIDEAKQPEIDQYPSEVTGETTEQREGSPVSEIQDVLASRQASEERDLLVEYNEQLVRSSSPAPIEPAISASASDVEMEDADLPTNVGRPSPISMPVGVSMHDAVYHTDVKMEEDQITLNQPLPNFLLNFPRLSPRPSQTRSLLLDVVPLTIPGIRSILFDHPESAPVEGINAGEGDDEKVFKVEPLPDTTFPPMPTSPLLTPYVDSLPLPRLDNLPLTLARKVPPAKLARRRDREREKDGKEDNKDRRDAPKSSWLPWEISRWNAHFRANPAHKMLRRSGKALTTRMWMVSVV